MWFDVYILNIIPDKKIYSKVDLSWKKYFSWSTDSNNVFLIFEHKKSKSMYKYPMYGHISWLYINQVLLMIIQTTNDMWVTIFYF